MSQDADSQKKMSPKQEPTELLAKARAAHAERKFSEARTLYDQAVEAAASDQGKGEVADQARAFRALLAQEAPAGDTGDFSAAMGLGVGLGGMVLMGLGVAAIWSPDIRALWRSYWYLLIGGLYVLLLLMVGLKRMIGFFKGGADSQRAAVILLVVPLIVTAMMALIFIGGRRMAAALELVWILVAALIPAAAYYLFLSTRRPSILNEFVSNLSRLGLLSKRRVRHSSDATEPPTSATAEPDEARRARIESYFQRFEAIYGALRFADEGEKPISRSRYVEQLINAVDQNGPSFRIPQGAVRFTDIFRANLMIPIGLVTILTTLGWLLVLQPDFSELRGEAKPGSAKPAGSETSQVPPPASESPRGSGDVADLTLNFTPVSFAFLGAYFFGVQMLFRRFVRRDLGPNAYFAFANRIVLAIIAVWVTVVAYSVIRAGPQQSSEKQEPQGAAAQAPPPAAPAGQSPAASAGLMRLATGANVPSALLILGFLVGVFPRLLWQFLSAAVTKIPGIKPVMPSIEAKQPLSELDGLTVWHESRLEEEDVENVPNMASVDVVDLMLHTQIPAERLIGWIDQAILYSVLGPHGASQSEGSPRSKLRNLGLRTASQVAAAAHSEVAEERQALASACAGCPVGTVVHALEIEANFDVVRSWRQV